MAIPIGAMIAASAIPTVASLLMGGGSSRPAGPDYSQIMAIINSPEMKMYREQLLRNAFNPNSELFQTASNQAYAQANRAAASRGLGTSGAGLGFIQGAQTDLANRFAENELQRQIQAFNAASNSLGGNVNSLMNMANSNYQAQLGGWQDEQQSRAGFIGGLNNMVNAGLSAYTYNQNMKDLQNMMSGYGARTPGYGGSINNPYTSMIP